jgi:predicted O-methyltransferase YrrM
MANFISMARTAIRDPGAALCWVIRGRLTPERLSKILGCNTRRIYDLYSEIDSLGLRERIESTMRATGKEVYGQIWFGRELYVVARVLEPDRVVETGVSGGVSSAFILQALKNNRRGRLLSIDFPNAGWQELLPVGKESGWVVPQELKERWDLRLGRSIDLLPALLKDLGSIGVFLHDSDHSYQNMLFEFSTSWPKLVKGGLLVSDNVLENSAFFEFAKSVYNQRSLLWRMTPGSEGCLGLLKKT